MIKQHKYRIVAVCVLAMILLSANVDAEQSSELTVEAKGILNSNGFLMVALYNNRKSYEGGADMAIAKEKATIVNNCSRVVFRNIPYGSYAAALFHDENGDGELDRNLIGIPKEAYGFSNNARGSLGPPDFDDSRFEVNKPQVFISVTLK